MDHHTPDTLPSVELPSPQPIEQTPETTPQNDMYSEQVGSKQVELAPAAVPPGTNNQAVAPQTPLPTPLISPHDEPAAGITGVATTPQIADDTDLIEKEWVDRAKRIVEHTKHDPHEQTKEMSNMRTDYLKKRYNKDTKLSD